MTLIFEFLGLLGLEDPIRPKVPAAIAECCAAGIRVVMITGDYPATARAIAHESGLAESERSDHRRRVGDADRRCLAPAIGNVSVFARVVPEQKLRIVKALKANGEVVAMTGDGVNDAPALKRGAHRHRHGRARHRCRPRSGIVWCCWTTISLRSCTQCGWVVASTTTSARPWPTSSPCTSRSPACACSRCCSGLARVCCPRCTWSLLELIIDPACSIAFENEPAESDVMQRPPRDAAAPLFGGATLWLALLQGLGVLAVVLAAFAWAAARLPEPEARAFAFATLVVGNLASILSNRSATRSLWASLCTPNKTLWVVVSLAFALLLSALYIPWLWACCDLRPCRRTSWPQLVALA